MDKTIVVVPGEIRLKSILKVKQQLEDFDESESHSSELATIDARGSSRRRPSAAQISRLEESGKQGEVAPSGAARRRSLVRFNEIPSVVEISNG